MIKEDNEKFTVESESGEALSIAYNNKSDAESRLKQIESLPSSDETAEYKGETVKLDSPFVNDKFDYSVYAKNQNDDVVLVRFTGAPTSIESKDKSTPSYWNGLLSGAKFQDFKHTAFFDMSTKTIRSVRDGVQEYLGVELGIEPSNKIFTLYRSPETITAITGMMDSLPIINDHIDPSVTPTKKQTIGLLESPDVVEFEDEATFSTLYLESKASLSNDMIKLKDGGKKEFSLGYLGKMREHDVYDFEQYDINPTHLALVDSARGGSVLTFVDKKGHNMSKQKKFEDMDGMPNLQQIVEVAKKLPEAIEALIDEEKAEAMTALSDVFAMSTTDNEMEVEDAEPEEKEVTDSDEEKENFEDSAKFKGALSSGIDSAVKLHSQAIEKAKNFVGESYSFADKSTKQIMIDALATEHGNEKFEDAELTTAFKLLKRSTNLDNFAKFEDANSLDARIEQSLEG